MNSESMTPTSSADPTVLRPATVLLEGETYPRGLAPSSEPEVIDATVAHIYAPLAESVALGYAPENPSPNLLERHFEFFDPNRDGNISFPEGVQRWGSLGFSRLPAEWKAGTTAAVFSRTGWNVFILQIDISAAMAELRPEGSTGVFDAEGYLDEARFRGVMQDFLNYSRRHGSREPGHLGELSQDQFRGFLEEIGVRGIPTRQFESMLDILNNAGYDGPIRPMHLAMNYSGALLYNVEAAVAQRRAQDTTTPTRGRR